MADPRGDLAKLFRKVREDSKLKQAEFARALRVTPTFISQMENEIAVPGVNLVRRMGEKFGADTKRIYALMREVELSKLPDELKPEEEPKARKAAKVPVGHFPVVGLAACGRWQDEGAVDRHPWGEMRTTDLFSDVKASSRAYVVFATGKSMTGSGIHEGDALLVDPRAQLVNGKIALVRVDGKVTIKQWRELEDRYLLTATNADFEPQEMVLKKSEYDDRVAWAHRVTAHRPAVRLL